MKRQQIILKTFRRVTPAGLWLTAAVLAISMGASPFALAAKPNCPDPDDHRCDETVQNDFNFIFEGVGSIFNEDDGGQPWAVTSPAQELEGIVLGPVPIRVDQLAAIGDNDQPCGITGKNDCADRFESVVEPFTPDQFHIVPTGSRNPEYIVLWFTFALYDDDDETVYKYAAKTFSTRHIVVWDPADKYFCVPVTFERTWVLETDPADYQRKKMCHESKYFAVCEVDDQEYVPNDFQMTIWRADHPVYLEHLENGGSPLFPPC